MEQGCDSHTAQVPVKWDVWQWLQWFRGCKDGHRNCEDVGETHPSSFRDKGVPLLLQNEKQFSYPLVQQVSKSPLIISINLSSGQKKNLFLMFCIDLMMDG